MSINLDNLLFLKAMYEYSPIGITIMNSEGRYIFVNNEFCNYIGYTEDELYKMTYRDVTYSEDIDLSDSIIKKITSGEITRYVEEKRYQSKHGEIIRCSISSSIIHGESGLLLINFVKDLSEIIASRKKVLDRELLFNDYFENIPIGSVLLNNSGIILKSNNAVSRILGYSKEELEGNNFMKFSYNEDMQHSQTVFKQFVKGEIESYSSDKRYIKKDGTKIWGNIKVSRVKDAQGNVFRIIATFEDVTDKIVAKDEILKAKAAAESASLEKSKFLANMSHEIRTPMNGILGMLDLLIISDLTEDQKEYLEIARNSSKSLMRLLNDILDYSKIEADKLVFEDLPFSIREVVDEVREIFEISAKGKGLKIICEVSDDVPEIVMGDSLRLRQVLSNLIGNSVKFTKVGQISITCKLIESDSKKYRMLFSVKDTGIGVSVKDQEKLFERFVQLDDSVTRKYGGVGLGLAISKRLVELMNGELKLSSEIGSGSDFYFEAEFKNQDEIS